MFQIRLTQEAHGQYDHLKKDKGLLKRHKAVQKTLQFLKHNPRHPGLQTHKFTSLKGVPKGKISLSLTPSKIPLLPIVYSGIMARTKTNYNYRHYTASLNKRRMNNEKNINSYRCIFVKRFAGAGGGAR